MAALLGGAAYLVLPFVSEWAPWARVDTLAVACSLAAVRQADRSGVDSRNRHLYLAAVLCAAALFTKQTAIAAPIAITVWLIWRRQYRLVLAWVVGVGALTAVAYLLFNAWNGSGFLYSVVSANALPFRPRTVVNIWRWVVILYGWFLVAAGYFAFRALRSRRPNVLVTYLIFAAFVTASVGRMGASLNYFLEFLAICTACAAAAWALVLRSAGSRLLPAAATAGFVLQLAWIPVADASPLGGLLSRTREFAYVPSRLDAEKVRRIESQVAARGGRLLTEDAIFGLHLDEHPYAIPSSALELLSLAGRWDAGQRRLSDEIAARRFATIVLTKKSYPPAILRAIEANYSLSASVPDVLWGYWMYVPRE